MPDLFLHIDPEKDKGYIKELGEMRKISKEYFPMYTKASFLIHPYLKRSCSASIYVRGVRE